MYKNYKDLIVWKKALELTTIIYDLIKILPPEEKFALSDQMRRAAISIPSNIAEGAGRIYNKEFKKFLSNSKGSLFELETQILICIKTGYFNENDCSIAMSLIDEISRMLTSLMAYNNE